MYTGIGDFILVIITPQHRATCSHHHVPGGCITLDLLVDLQPRHCIGADGWFFGNDARLHSPTTMLSQTRQRLHMANQQNSTLGYIDIWIGDYDIQHVFQHTKGRSWNIGSRANL